MGVCVVFYDQFIAACARQGVSPTRVLIALGMSKSSLARWRSGGDPLNETKKKIADHLGISISELLDKKNKPATKDDDGLMREFNKLFIRLTPEQQDSIIQVMQHMRY
jgi:transcriptional regulator with XRE-family HTH domain